MEVTHSYFHFKLQIPLTKYPIKWIIKSSAARRKLDDGMQEDGKLMPQCMLFYDMTEIAHFVKAMLINASEDFRLAELSE